MKNILKLKTRNDKKQYAQDLIMDGIGNVLGYWMEQLSEEERDALGMDGINEMCELVHQQADRVAKMFGFDKAWSN